MSAARRFRLLPVAALLGAFALGAVLPGAFADGGSEPTATRYALSQTSQVQGAPGRTLALSKVVIDPGVKLGLHHHLGTQVARIASGTLTYTVRHGSVTVREGPSDGQSRLVRKIKAGQTGQIHAGQWLVEQPSAHHEAVNRGKQPVVVFLATLLEKGAPPATPLTEP